MRHHPTAVGILIVVAACAHRPTPLFAPNIFIPHVDPDSIARDSTGRRVAALVGAVLDSAAGSPLETTQILLQPSSSGRSYFAYTDKRGSFIIRRVEPGSYRVLVRRIGYMAQTEQRNLTASAIDTLVVRMKMAPPCKGGIECY
ncbi:MAG: carboxypeptidase-like regulatory domain-containing protein [Gemmatimonadaceae bacterium]